MEKDQYLNIGSLSVAENLYNFVNNELLSGTGINANRFWINFDKAVNELAIKNKNLLNRRDKIQRKINGWHQDRLGKKFKSKEYEKFLKDIGYILNEGNKFKIQTKNIDDEISSIAGPQLVVPIMNARYTLNAANARWVSLYDSLYGTDVIESDESGGERYDPIRGEEVIKYSKNFLDNYFPINKIKWKDVTSFVIEKKELKLFKNNQIFSLKKKINLSVLEEKKINLLQ